jgi:hypothetical protein
MAKLISLYGMIEIIEEYDPKVFDRIFLPDEKMTNAFKLFTLLRGNPNASEEKISKMYSNTSKSYTSYLRNKQLLEEKLSGGVCLINWKKEPFNADRKIYYTNIKRIAAATLLLFRHKRYAGIPMLEKTWKELNKLKDLLILPFITRYLFNHYSQWEYCIDKTLYYHQKQSTILKEFQLFQTVSHLQGFTDILTRRKNHKKLQITLEQVEGQLFQAYKKIKNYSSPELIAYIVRSLSKVLIKKKEYQKAMAALEIGSNRIHQINSNTPPRAINQNLTLYKIWILIHNENYELAIKVIKQSIQNYPKRENRVLLQLQIMAHFKLLEFNLAYYIYTSREYQKYFKSKIHSTITENSHLFHAYFALLIKAGVLEQAPNHPPFRLGKFLNQVPEFSKDKKGMNISILIIQALILLADRKYDAFLDRLECLRVYNYKHLAKDHDLFRASTFIKMLQLIPKAHYDRERLEWRGKRYLEKMDIPREQLPISATDLEIIPFEDLWEIVLHMMDSRQGKQRREEK